MFASVMNFAGRRARFSLASEMPVSGRFPVGENEVRWVTLLPSVMRAHQIQNCATLGIREVSYVQGQHALALKELTQ